MRGLPGALHQKGHGECKSPQILQVLRAEIWPCLLCERHACLRGRHVAMPCTGHEPAPPAAFPTLIRNTCMCLLAPRRPAILHVSATCSKADGPHITRHAGTRGGGDAGALGTRSACNRTRQSCSMWGFPDLWDSKPASGKHPTEAWLICLTLWVSSL